MAAASSTGDAALPLAKGITMTKATTDSELQKRRVAVLTLVLLALFALFALNEIVQPAAPRSGYEPAAGGGVIESAEAYDVAQAHGMDNGGGGAEQNGATPRGFRDEKKIVVLLSSGRDTESCARSIIAARDLALRSARVHFRVYEEIVVNHDDSCLQVYCDLRPRDCKVLLRAKRLRVVRRDVSGALGASVALHLLEGAVERKQFEHEFYLSIDSNVEFTKHWDLELLRQWYSIGNDRAILSVAPPAVETKGMNGGIFFLQCSARIHSKAADPVVEFNPPEPKALPKHEGVAAGVSPRFASSPVLQAQYSERFHFGLVSSLLRVRSDPHLVQLVVGHEYMRATRFWTLGFDFYAPTSDILYYRYELPLAPHEKGQTTAAIEVSSRRIRRILRLPMSSPLWDHEPHAELDKYAPGTNRSLEAWHEFSAIDAAARFNASTTNHFADNCDRTLRYVHYE